MRYYNLSDSADLVAPLIASGKLVPVFGAGFTFNEKAKNGFVPNGNECCTLFKGLLSPENAVDEFPGDLMELSDELFSALKHGRLSYDIWIRFLRSHFTDVHLSPLKTKFLSLPWPFAFTLNIDDGIEKAGEFKEILPYQRCRKQPGDNNKILYKLHGDAEWECNYISENNLVFNFNQYIKSILLPENQTMRDTLLSAFKSLNMIFIGCSLKKEPDLEYVCELVANDTLNKKNILVCGSKPNSRAEERLSDRYGITDIIVVDSNYDQFYTNIIKRMQCADMQKQVESYEFACPKIVVDERLDYFTGMNIFEHETNTFHRSKYFAERDLTTKIEEDFLSAFIVVVGGRRFSGKTTLLALLAEREKTRDVYFFPSDTQVDSNVVQNICESHQNKLLLFDSNSISASVYRLLTRLPKTLKENNNRIVAILGLNDSLPFNNEGIVYEFLSGKFNDNECAKLNTLTSSIPLTARNRKHSNLDYLLIIKEQQGIHLTLQIKEGISFTENEQILMLILSVKEKIYEKEFSIALDIDDYEISGLLEKMSGMVERIPTTAKESRAASSSKLVHNSRIVLDKYIQTFSEEDIIRDIRRIVKAFRHGSYDQKLIYREVMKYDSLNQLFGGISSRISAPVIIQHVYSNLEDLLNDDMHYWLQRAKCIYRINYKDIASLRSSYQYAKYVYNGTDKERLKKQSALSVSLICAYMAKLVSEEDELRKLYIESIERGHEAMFSDYFMDENYRKAFLSERNYSSLITEICVNVNTTGIYDKELLEKAHQIIDKLRSAKTYHQTK